MNLESFISLLQHQEALDDTKTIALGSIVKEHPYFQAARVLHLLGLKKQDSFKYNKALKTTAAHTTDRSILFDIITNATNIKRETIVSQTEKGNKEDTFKTTRISKEKDTVTQVEKDLSIGKPIHFNASENYSFNQWLQLGVKKPIVRTPKKETNEKAVLVNQFIENNPKIEPLEKGKTVSTKVSPIAQDSYLMTETLAKVYLEQKKYDNAIQAYRILSLKYPEKSGFFADQIKRVEILQKHKS